MATGVSVLNTTVVGAPAAGAAIVRSHFEFAESAVQTVRALVLGPQLLLLDEPSLGLAPKLVTDLFATLAELRDEGMTILLVDQMASLALAVADRAYLLETGRVVQSGTGKEMQQDDQVMKAYLGA